MKTDKDLHKLGSTESYCDLLSDNKASEVMEQDSRIDKQIANSQRSAVCRLRKDNCGSSPSGCVFFPWERERGENFEKGREITPKWQDDPSVLASKNAPEHRSWIDDEEDTIAESDPEKAIHFMGTDLLADPSTCGDENDPDTGQPKPEEDNGPFGGFSTEATEKDLFPEEEEKYIEDYFEQIEIYLRYHRYKDALDLTLATLQRQPTHPGVLQKLAYVENYTREKCFQQEYVVKKKEKTLRQADKWAMDGSGWNSSSARADGTKATPLTIRRDAPAKKTTQTQKLHPAEMMQHLRKGIALWKKGEADKAIREFDIASASEKHWVYCQTMLGVCYAGKNRAMDAIGHFKLGLHSANISSRNQISLYYKLGCSYEFLNAAGEALYYYSRVVRQCPDYRDVKLRIAKLKRHTKSPLDS